MIAYNERIDEQISEILRHAGRVLAGDLPGLTDAEGAQLLARYVEVHGAEVPLRFDGAVLTWDVQAPPPEPVPVPPPAAPSPAPPSPVDQVMAAPQGKALLDTAPVGAPVSKAFWLLPLTLGALGGLIGWLVVRHDNPRVGRSLLIAGIAIQVATFCLGVAAFPMMRAFVPQSGSAAGGALWEATGTGRPVFHYFGTAT